MQKDILKSLIQNIQILVFALFVVLIIGYLTLQKLPIIFFIVAPVFISFCIILPGIFIWTDIKKLEILKKFAKEDITISQGTSPDGKTFYILYRNNKMITTLSEQELYSYYKPATIEKI